MAFVNHGREDYVEWLFNALPQLRFVNKALQKGFFVYIDRVLPKLFHKFEQPTSGPLVWPITPGAATVTTTAGRVNNVVVSTDADLHVLTRFANLETPFVNPVFNQRSPGNLLFAYFPVYGQDLVPAGVQKIQHETQEKQYGKPLECTPFMQELIQKLRVRIRFLVEQNAPVALAWLLTKVHPSCSKVLLFFPRSPMKHLKLVLPFVESNSANSVPVHGFSVLNDVVKNIGTALLNNSPVQIASLLNIFFRLSKNRLEFNANLNLVLQGPRPRPPAAAAAPGVPATVVPLFAPQIRPVNVVVGAPLSNVYYTASLGVANASLDALYSIPAAFPTDAMRLLMALENERLTTLTELRQLSIEVLSGQMDPSKRTKRNLSVLSAVISVTAPTPIYERGLYLVAVPESIYSRGVSWTNGAGYLRQRIVEYFTHIQAEVQEVFFMVGTTLGMNLKVNPFTTNYPHVSLFAAFSPISVHDGFLSKFVLSSVRTLDDLALYYQFTERLRVREIYKPLHDVELPLLPLETRYKLLKLCFENAEHARVDEIIPALLPLDCGEIHKGVDFYRMVSDAEGALKPYIESHRTAIQHLYRLKTGRGNTTLAFRSPSWRVVLDPDSSATAIANYKLADVRFTSIPLGLWLTHCADLNILLAIFCKFAKNDHDTTTTVAAAAEEPEDLLYNVAELDELHGRLRPIMLAEDDKQWNAMFDACMNVNLLTPRGIFALSQPVFPTRSVGK